MKFFNRTKHRFFVEINNFYYFCSKYIEICQHYEQVTLNNVFIHIEIEVLTMKIYD